MASDDSFEAAPFACTAKQLAAREHKEKPDPLRTPFALDRHRIIGCTAFRRLEGKTQVFAPSHHDHFRTRLTHTLEASHIARTLARALRANEDLAEAITLAHDLGHPPFGHAGEKALAEAMADAGGFNHNLHALRVVEYLEHPFPAFRGLNLSEATRAGLAAHATTYDVADEDVVSGEATVEAQISSLADRIAYNCHDLEDAIGAAFIGQADLESLTLWRIAMGVAEVTGREYSLHAVRRPVLDAMLDAILQDAITTSTPLLARVKSLDDVAKANSSLITLSSTMSTALSAVERLLAEHVHRHPDVVAADTRGQAMIHGVFRALRDDPAKLPKRFAARIEEQGRDLVVCDFVAGMTDRYCSDSHAALTDSSV